MYCGPSLRDLITGIDSWTILDVTLPPGWIEAVKCVEGLDETDDFDDSLRRVLKKLIVR